MCGASTTRRGKMTLYPITNIDRHSIGTLTTSNIQRCQSVQVQKYLQEIKKTDHRNESKTNDKINKTSVYTKKYKKIIPDETDKIGRQNPSHFSRLCGKTRRTNIRWMGKGTSP
jgi:hypothetical protein